MTTTSLNPPNCNILRDNCTFKILGYNNLICAQNIEKHVILCEQQTTEFKFAVVFETFGTWKLMSISTDYNYYNISYTPNNDTWININLNDQNVTNDMFSASNIRPNHEINSWVIEDFEIKHDSFTRTSMDITRRQVWILVGPSGLGKSFLASHLKNLWVYETDTSQELPEKIEHDVIVMGNKYRRSVIEIIRRIYEHVDVIPVTFNKRYDVYTQDINNWFYWQNIDTHSNWPLNREDYDPLSR